jgi:hypothetical protein
MPALNHYGIGYFEHLRSNLELPSTMNIYSLQMQAFADPMSFVKALEEFKAFSSDNGRFHPQRKQKGTIM